MSGILQTAVDRGALRRQVRVPCQVVDEVSFTLLAHETLDLSLEGMCVRALRPATLGSELLVSFRIPGSSLYVDAEAVVTRMIWGRRRDDRYTAFGLAFKRLENIDRAILASRLRGLPPPVPARRLRVDYAQSVADIARGLSQMHHAA